MGIQESIIRGFAVCGALATLLAVIGLVTIFFNWPPPEQKCSCQEYMGDDPSCPQHAALAQYLQNTGRQPTHFEHDVDRLYGKKDRPS